MDDLRNVFGEALLTYLLAQDSAEISEEGLTDAQRGVAVTVTPPGGVS